MSLLIKKQESPENLDNKVQLSFHWRHRLLSHTEICRHYVIHHTHLEQQAEYGKTNTDAPVLGGKGFICYFYLRSFIKLFTDMPHARVCVFILKFFF